MICPTCRRPFDPADRASPNANEGAVGQIVYCREECARKAENQRYYAAHKEEIKKRVKRNQEKGQNP